MSEEGNGDRSRLILKIPIIKAESETQTSGHLISRSPEEKTSSHLLSPTVEQPIEMESTDQKMSIRKRRNLSKNRGQATRMREKTPEPSRMAVPHEDTTTSDDEDVKTNRNSREIEADSTYEEMKRLVQEQAGVKDPVYDLDTEEVLGARLTAANERRRRSISPFAVHDKEDDKQLLDRKGSFMDPTNKLLSTSYTLSPKDEDRSRRNSLTIEPPTDTRGSLSPPNISPKDTTAPPLPAHTPPPALPKKMEEIVYPDEKVSDEVPTKTLKTPVTKESVFTFEEKDIKPVTKAVSSKTHETPTSPGELVTKVIQIERTPSRKLSQDMKPVVEIRNRIVRTPSRKLSSDIKPVLKPQPKPVNRDEPQSKPQPPVKPARSKSASRFGNKTSESEMSEDQLNQQNIAAGPKRRVVPTPRRFVKNRSPRTNRSQSVARVEEVKVIDRSGLQMSQTSLEIVHLMQQARARSLSIPKDDPRLPAAYKNHSRNLQTPNKTPSTPRRTREISCPKTIQIISDTEILSGLTTNKRMELEIEKRRRSSGYIDASQSEYTSSCSSSSPSENEYDFDLSERTAELTRKLHLLSQEVDKREIANNNNRSVKDNEQKQEIEPKSVLRKRSGTDGKNGIKKERKKSVEDKKSANVENDKKKKPVYSKWKLLANWQLFKEEQNVEYKKIIFLRNQCISDTLLLIIMCGLGGMMFRSLEGSFENAYKCGTRNVKRDFIESLWRGSHYLREEDWKSMARTKLYEFENQLHNAHEAGVTSFSGQRSWSFINSFVYCLTLVTTMGYGHIAPKTMYGRIATIIYAIIGIPLFLIVLADFGKLFTRIIKFFWAFIRRFYYTRSCRKVRRTAPVQNVMKGLNIAFEAVRRPSQIFTEEEIQDDPDGDSLPSLEEKPGDVPPPLPPKPGAVFDPEAANDLDTPAPSVFEIDDEFNLPITVAIVILILYIVVGAAIFNYWESWNFCDSFYFVFISMSTIGLGDFVPSRPIYMMVTMLYLVFGLALTSMCINVVQVKLSDTFKQASAKLGATIGLRVAEEDGSLVPITPPPIEIAPVHKPKSEKEESKSKENHENDSKNK